jgi:hypothetical protein
MKSILHIPNIYKIIIYTKNKYDFKLFVDIIFNYDNYIQYI